MHRVAFFNLRLHLHQRIEQLYFRALTMLMTWWLDAIPGRTAGAPEHFVCRDLGYLWTSSLELFAGSELNCSFTHTPPTHKKSEINQNNRLKKVDLHLFLQRETISHSAANQTKKQNIYKVTSYTPEKNVHSLSLIFSMNVSVLLSIPLGRSSIRRSGLSDIRQRDGKPKDKMRNAFFWEREWRCVVHSDGLVCNILAFGASSLRQKLQVPLRFLSRVCPSR